MSYDIIRDAESVEALFDNGKRAFFWEDQCKWALRLYDDSHGDGLVCRMTYSGLHSIAAFVDRWDDKTAAACKLAGISAQQWWTLTEALERD